jgi:Arc/MetJ-type ribon-helix-helix transcriptional regulator
MSLNVSLSGTLEQLVRTEVASGAYATPAAVIEAALQQFFTPSTSEHSSWLAADIRRRIQRIDAGQATVRDAEAYFDALEQRIQALPDA